MKVEVLGPGCANCERLKERTENVVEDLQDKDMELVEVEDVEEIAEKGVMNTPALAVDGEVKISGRVPSEEEIREVL